MTNRAEISIPEEILRERSLRYSQESSVAGSEEIREFLAFRIGTEWFLLPDNVLDEVISHTHISELPHQESFLRGLTNVRGDLLMVLDLTKILEVSLLKEAKMPRQKMIIVNWKGEKTGFLTDQILGTEGFNPRDLQDQTLISENRIHEFIHGIFKARERQYLWLNLEAVLSHVSSQLSARRKF